MMMRVRYVDASGICRGVKFSGLAVKKRYCPERIDSLALARNTRSCSGSECFLGSGNGVVFIVFRSMVVLLMEFTLISVSGLFIAHGWYNRTHASITRSISIFMNGGACVSMAIRAMKV